MSARSAQVLERIGAVEWIRTTDLLVTNQGKQKQKGEGASIGCASLERLCCRISNAIAALHSKGYGTAFCKFCNALCVSEDDAFDPMFITELVNHRHVGFEVFAPETERGNAKVACRRLT